VLLFQLILYDLQHNGMQYFTVKLQNKLKLMRRDKRVLNKKRKLQGKGVIF